MNSYLSGLAILVWGFIGLFVALIAFGVRGKKGFIWTLLIMWVVFPLGLKIYGGFNEFLNKRLMVKLQDEYKALCATPNREVVLKTVENVEDVAVWPAKGPRDGWENDLFFPARKTANEWIKGRDGGRYGGFRRALLESPDSKATNTPRYQVVFQELNAGIVDGKPFIRGAHIRVIDKHTGELLAERKDYVGQMNFGFPHGCDSTERGRTDKWFNDNLSFIHKVLNPPPGVKVTKREMSNDLGKPKVIPATVIQEMAPSRTHVPLNRGLPSNIRYQSNYRSTLLDVQMTGYSIVFMHEDRDVVVPQNLEVHSNLLALALDGRDYVAIFWIGEPEYLLLRRFSPEGELLAHQFVRFPRSMQPVKFLNSPDKILSIEPTRYRIRLSLNPSQGQFEKDIELAFPRTTRTSRKQRPDNLRAPTQSNNRINTDTRELRSATALRADYAGR
jgi:hypothetical protein